MRSRPLTTSTKAPVGTPAPAETEAAASAFASSGLTSGSASFNNGLLTAVGTADSNLLSLSRDAAGQIIVNYGNVPIAGGTATVFNTKQIALFGLDGPDVISVDESLGKLPGMNIYAGTGSDLVMAGSGADKLFGESGNDKLEGRGGQDQLFGGIGDDILEGGDGDDQMLGGDGNDLMLWNPGDDNDLMEGGAGTDTVEVNGGGGTEHFTVRANGQRVLLERVAPAAFTLDIGSTEQIVLQLKAGDDTFSASGNLAALTTLTVDGGAGNDTLLGGNGADTLIGGEGHDFIDGQQGNDTVRLGDGNDAFQWDAGDGSDTVDGGAGQDRMAFNGSFSSETFEVGAVGNQLRVTRHVGGFTVDAQGIERLDLGASGGSDSIILSDLAGTGVQHVQVSLAASIGGDIGDAASDTVILEGQTADDFISVNASSGTVTVTGLQASLAVTQAEAGDNLLVRGGAGNDQIFATGVHAGQLRLTLEGGAGDDILRGGAGADHLRGGDGDDFVSGGRGVDLIQLGAGHDAFAWVNGDGSDTVDGGEGNDVMNVQASSANDSFELSAEGSNARLSGKVGAVTLQSSGVEGVVLQTLGGSDRLTVNDLSGTALRQIDVRLGADSTSGDATADVVTQRGTAADDHIVVSGTGSQLSVAGLHAQLALSGADTGLDELILDARAGDDLVDARALGAQSVKLTLSGGAGNDQLLGSAGVDTFHWLAGDGNDLVDGGAGLDAAVFWGDDVAERWAVDAGNGHATVTRDLDAATVQLALTEVVQLQARGGADHIHVGSLAGTGVSGVRIDLASAEGAGDGVADRIVLQGSDGVDEVMVRQFGTTVEVLGLGARVLIENFDAGLDILVVQGLGGDDVIDARGLTASGMAFEATGDGGRDLLIGGAGNDLLLGGEGDDVLIGQGGLDTLDGGPGVDMELQS